MNSYYTNQIEGQHTRPADIERALRRKFDADAAIAARQRLALAHMKVEEELEQKLDWRTPQDLFSGVLVREIHRLLYSELPGADRVTGEGAPIVPGEYRRKDLTAGRHVAPPWKEVEGLVQGWAERYRTLSGAEALAIGAACSHHRLAWIHPFIWERMRSTSASAASGSIPLPMSSRPMRKRKSPRPIGREIAFAGPAGGRAGACSSAIANLVRRMRAT